jgi:glycine/D-amino acid oxidase-like deaminating enzyme
MGGWWESQPRRGAASRPLGGSSHSRTALKHVKYDAVADVSLNRARWVLVSGSAVVIAGGAWSSDFLAQQLKDKRCGSRGVGVP